MKHLHIVLLLLLMVVCNNSDSKKKKEVTVKEKIEIPKLTIEQANRLVDLPLSCINMEFPNKLNQTLGTMEDLQSPKKLHPAFYGCFDWHSSVHGHWSLVSLLKQFPTLNHADKIKKILLNNISKENIKQEVKYFYGYHNKNYERTYGWAWVLKLAEELHTWDNEIARKLEENLQPLTDLIIEKYIDFLPKLVYPIRVGEHTNTAFGLTFAWDYANTVGHSKLKKAIEKRAKEFYLKDANCPISWEPSGYDFLSPCLEEAAIMKRVLSKEEFKPWFEKFLPQLKDKNYKLAVGEVSDRKDGKLVHLDGANFSRAWSLYTIVKNMSEYNHLKNIANKHINYSLPNIVDDDYEGGTLVRELCVVCFKFSS